MRKVVLDTETTGLDPLAGHRIVEIGCVELVNDIPTGEIYHTYLNPEREMPDTAFAIHGLSVGFLEDKPLFASEVENFLEFLGNSALVIHNAEFDLSFVNAELAIINYPMLTSSIIIDTVALARRKYPGQPANLDALCRRFGIDAEKRTKHGALLDAQLLSSVYLELLGGAQPGLGLQSETPSGAVTSSSRERRNPRPHESTAEEKEAHTKFIETLTDPIWRQ